VKRLPPSTIEIDQPPSGNREWTFGSLDGDPAIWKPGEAWVFVDFWRTADSAFKDHRE
jgi:hypothetical protein